MFGCKQLQARSYDPVFRTGKIGYLCVWWFQTSFVNELIDEANLKKRLLHPGHRHRSHCRLLSIRQMGNSWQCEASVSRARLASVRLFPEDTGSGYCEQSAFSAATEHGIRWELANILRQQPYREVLRAGARYAYRLEVSTSRLLGARG